MAILHTESFNGAVGPVTEQNTIFDYVGGTPEIVTGGLIGNGMQAATTTAAAAFGQFWLSATRNSVYQRFYVKMVNTGTTFYLCQTHANTSQIATLSVQSDSGMRMRQGSSTTIGDSFTPTKLSTTEWTRIEWGITDTTMQLKMFQGENLHGTTPTYDSGALAWTGTPFNRTAIGSTVSVAGVNVLIDEYAVADDWVGPAQVTPTSPWQRKTDTGWQRMKAGII